MKIFVYEMKKILIKQYAIIILAAVVIVRLLSSLPLAKQTYGFDSATEREKYFEIISPFIGAVTEEKTDRADELENQLKTASQQYDKLIDQRLEHKISDIEYYEQMKLYEPTLNIKKQIEKTVEQVRQAQERQCDILPVSYVPIICDASADYLFVLAICLICSLSVITEYTSKTRYILCTTPQDSHAVWRQKRQFCSYRSQWHRFYSRRLRDTAFQNSFPLNTGRIPQEA